VRPADVVAAARAAAGTSAGRAGVLHAALTLVAALAILATVYLATAVYERDAIEKAVLAEGIALARLAEPPGSRAELAAEINRLTAAGRAGRSVRALVGADGAWAAGTAGLGTLREGPQSAIIAEGEHAGERLYGVGLRLPDGALLFIGRDESEIEDLEELIIRAVVIAGGIAILLSLGGGILLGRSVNRRASAYRQALAHVADGDLGHRLPERPGGDEFDSLAADVNGTLTRLEAAVTGLRQVSGDIAHDLRTPLSRMRQRLDRAIRSDDAGPVPRIVVERAIADVDEVLVIFEAVLRIAQIEAGERRAKFTTFDLSAALSTVADAMGAAAEEAGHPFAASIVPGIQVHGDRELLQQALVNLVENAIRHSPPGTPVRISLRRDGQAAVAMVADSGPGIPAADRERVLRPFVRLEESRTTPGTGLGLALVKAVADLHSARLELTDAGPGLAVTLTVTRAALQTYA
jgi:signal transduction histidine kinase